MFAPMEHALRKNMLTCARAYSAKMNLELSTLGHKAAGDWRFFTDLKQKSKSFTARKYDQVIEWFDVNWPQDLAWPAGVARPSAGPKARAS